MSSHHIEAKPGEIAETVLLPGDPLRAKYIAEQFLQEVKCYNQVRNMLGFTGLFKGNRVSVQGAGMGMGSTAIYVHELINSHGVQNLIRVGTCGAIREELEVGEIILALSASGDSGHNKTYFQGNHYAATADFGLLVRAYQIANQLNIRTHQETIFSTDTFYDSDPQRWDKWELHGVAGVEMESQILYTIAKRFGVKALSILTVSDNLKTGQAADQLSREQSFTDMMRIALELA